MCRVMAYVENNPVRAGMVERAEDFEWSSAGAHLGRISAGAMLDMEWWQARWAPEDWRGVLLERAESVEELRHPPGDLRRPPSGIEAVHCWIRKNARQDIGGSHRSANEADRGWLRRSIAILECGVRMAGTGTVSSVPVVSSLLFLF